MNLKGIGRLFALGIAKETTRGTAISSASYWLPFSETSIEEKFENVTQDEAYGIIEDSVGQFRVKNWVEGTLKVPLTDQSLPLLLLSQFGSMANATHSGESAVYDHTLTVGQNAQHQSLTLFIHDPLSGVDYSHALGVIHKTELAAELKKFVELSLTVKALKGVAQSAFTPSIVAENRFLPQYMTFKYAPTVAGTGAGVTATGNTTNSSASVTNLSTQAGIQVGMTVTGTGIPAGTTVAALPTSTTMTLSQNATATNTGTTLTFTATPIQLKSLKLSIDSNVEDQEVLSSVAPVDFLNKEFKVEGSLEAIWQNESDFKTNSLVTPNGAQALLVDLVNTDVNIGTVPSHPEVKITLDLCYFTEFSRPIKVKDLVYQTLKFKATYSTANSEMIKALVTNTVASY